MKYCSEKTEIHSSKDKDAPLLVKDFLHEVRQEVQQIDLFPEIEGRSTDSSLRDLKEADTVINGICVGLKSTVIFFINSIPCRIISCAAAFS